MSVHWHTIWATLFGQGTWGAGGNMVAWVLCGAISFGWLRAKLHAHHVAQLAQAARHHREQVDQAAQHHQALIQQTARHHEQVLDRMDAHHAAMKAHVSTVNGSTRGLTGPLKGKAAKDG